MDAKQMGTPYDAELSHLHESSLYSHVERLRKSILEAKREGYLAGVKDTKENWREWMTTHDLELIYLGGFEDGVEAVKGDPDFYGLSSPTEGVRG